MEFNYFDISTDLAALKRFLKIRDNNHVFDGAKQRGAIGIPAVILEDKVIIDIDKERLLEEIK